MADTAFQVQYRQEFVAGFEQHRSLLSQCVTNEAIIKGNSAIFQVADSGSATATTRGVNGLIPARADNLNQYTATLVEWHDLVRKTSFNVFASQGDQRRIMQMTTMGVLNRKIDADIIGELDTGCTQFTGLTGQTMSLQLVMFAKTILGNNQVPLGSNLFGAISPAAEAYLMQTKEFANAEYITRAKPFENPPDFVDQPTSFAWAGVTWIVHPGLTGAGTATEKMYLWHRSALGHVTDTAGLRTPVGYQEEQDYSWARASAFMGTKTLQAKGIVGIRHDGSAFAATA